MLTRITLLLLFQLAGEVIAVILALPIPGPVIGMGLLSAALLPWLIPPLMRLLA